MKNSKRNKKFHSKPSASKPVSNPNENVEYKSYKEIVKENEKFTRYYQANEIPSADLADWNEFIAVAQKELPSTFRITGSRSCALQLRDHLKSKYFCQFAAGSLPVEMKNATASTEKTTISAETTTSAPEPIPWYPDELGWTIEGSKAALKKDEIYGQLHKFLINETEIGNITRQEAVSMIPPLLLDVQAGHCVLDMCAAPGSKTTQIIEALHQQDRSGHYANGLVIANDADNKRCYTLTHQAKRLQSPALLVTNHDASIFPKVMHINEQGQAEQLRFDRILCDVPCSGDGTMRKNPLVWRDWTAMQGNGLHSMQLKILERGCQLLKENGLIVYSTCSLNPVENEAVISEILSKYPECLELVDVSDQLPELIRRPGITNWQVMDKAGQLYQSFDQIPNQFQDKFRPSMFPSSRTKSQNINRCLRLYPHLQNTGGFFVAVLRKIGAIGSTSGAFAPSHVKFDGYKEKPFILMDGAENQQEINAIFNSFGIDPDKFSNKQYLVRSNEGKNRTIYYCSRQVQQILCATNEFGLNESLKIINTGIKGFSRNQSSTGHCELPYRLHYEHVQNIKSIMTKRIITISKADLKLCLENEFVSLDKLSADCNKSLASESRGCFVFSWRHNDDVDVSFPVWVGKSSATVYLVPEEKRSALERFYA